MDRRTTTDSRLRQGVTRAPGSGSHEITEADRRRGMLRRPVEDREERRRLRAELRNW